MNMKNLKLYSAKKLKELKTVTLATLLSGAIITSLCGCSECACSERGCCDQIEEKDDYDVVSNQTQDEFEEVEETEELKDTTEVEETDELEDATELEETEDLEKITEVEETKQINFDCISGPYVIKGYDNYVMIAVKNWKRYLIDADDFSKVLLSDFDYIGRAKYLDNYDTKNGGNSVSGEYSGYVRAIWKNDTPYIVDVNDFTKILATDAFVISDEGEDIHVEHRDGTESIISKENFVAWNSSILTDTDGLLKPDEEYENKHEEVINTIHTRTPIDFDDSSLLISAPFYFEKYDSAYGGLDDDGYLMNVYMDGEEYLVDASDFTVFDYDANCAYLVSGDNDNIIIRYYDEKTDNVIPQKQFSSTGEHILTKKLH